MKKRSTNENIKKELVFSEKNIETSTLFTTSQFKGGWREVAGKTFIDKYGDPVEPRIIIGKYPELDREFGVLTVSHYKLFLVLLKLWEEQGRPAQDGVGFSLYDLINRLNLKGGGRNYALIRRWFAELHSIPIIWQFSFYKYDSNKIKQLEERRDLYFNLVDEVFFKNTEEAENSIGGFMFSKPVINNLLAGYVKPVNVAQVTAFKKELSLLVYQYVDGKLAYSDSFSYSLKGFYAQFGLSEAAIRWETDRKNTFQRVINDLTGARLSCGDVITGVTISKRGSEYWMNIQKGKYAQQEALDEHDPRLVESLGSYGLTDQQIAGLLTDQSEAIIRSTLELIPVWLGQYKKAGKRINNRAAFIHKAITEHWAAKKPEPPQPQQGAKELLDGFLGSIKTARKPPAAALLRNEPFDLSELRPCPTRDTLHVVLRRELKKRRIFSDELLQSAILMGLSEGIDALEQAINEAQLNKNKCP